MEKTPAASAMEWSIKLEKNLRSKKPGKSLEALTEISNYIERWSRSPDLTFAEHKIYSMIPSEDKLFLNSIFLRLADALRLGNKEIKKCVVRCFLKLRKIRKRRGVEGLLSKSKLDNYLELLRRVKEVFDHGEVEERAAALVLFGCWAEFGCDCPDVRYIALSSLISSEDVEVKAALFAAGCLCELSEDFSYVFLEMLSSMLLSTDMSKDVKLTGARVLSKMSCSFPLADKAYKIGSKLLLNPSEDDFSAVTLISLSRIASRWTLLIPVQVELLSSFLTEERSLHLQATSLKCHRLLLSRGVCSYASTLNMVHRLFGILERSEFHPLHVDALRVLHKILLFALPTLPCFQISQLFTKLLAVVKNIERLPNTSSVVTAVNVLADICGKIFGRADLISSGGGSALSLQLVSFVFDWILFLVAPNTDVKFDLAAELKIKILLSILLNTVGKHPYLVSLVLNQVLLFIDKLVKMLDEAMDLENTKFSKDIKESLVSKVMFYVCKIIVACSRNFQGNDDETRNFLDGLKVIAEKVCKRSSYFGSNTSMSYVLLLHDINVSTLLMNNGSVSFHEKSSESCADLILQFDKSTLNSAKTLLGESNRWLSYRIGKSAVCHGAWSTAAFIFEKLTSFVESPSCSSWLKSLAIFSSSEKQIQLLVLSDRFVPVINFKHFGSGDIFLETKYGNCRDILLGACNELISAEQILSLYDTDQKFRFQRWFLTIRIKVLRAVSDVINVIETFSTGQNGTGHVEQLERGLLYPCTNSQTLSSLIYSLLDISCCMKNVARELDLLTMSVTHMDRQSMGCLSSLALSCSLMAFTFGFAFSVLDLAKSERSQEPLHVSLIEDLFGRLRYIGGGETQKKLHSLLKFFENRQDVSSAQFQTHNSHDSRESRILNTLCEYSAGEIYRLHNLAMSNQQGSDSLSQIVNDGSQLLSNIISKCMLIPFRATSHFFRVRPSASAELFLMNEEGQHINGLSISSESHLSLTMCLQLKNIPADTLSQRIKIHCILHCKASQATAENNESNSRAHAKDQEQEITDSMHLNEQLLRHVNSSETGRVHCTGQASDSLMVNKYVRFKLNESGQGFSTCLLDVSSFPVGSYRIKWHSGLVDSSSGCYLSLFSMNCGPLFHVLDVI